MVFREKLKKCTSWAGFKSFSHLNFLFWHISDVSFDRKHIKFINMLTITVGNWMAFSLFHKTKTFLWKIASKGRFEEIFEQKSGTRENPSAEIQILLYIYRKMEKSALRILTWIVMPLNFIHFHIYINICTFEPRFNELVGTYKFIR